MNGFIDEVNVDGLNREQKLKLLSRLLSEFAKEEIVNEFSIPVSIFNKRLGSLESIVKYMKEELKLSNKKIGEMLNRDNRTIWGIYNKAKTKNPEKLNVKSKLFIPIDIFKPRKLSVLEAIVYYLKEHYNLRLHEIALYLQRNDRTIWTVYQKAKHKAN